MSVDDSALLQSIDSLPAGPPPSSHLLFDSPTPSNTSLFGACQILLNTAIGSGALLVPYCFTSGIALELLISAVFAVLAFLSMHFLIESARSVRRYDYPALFDHCFGEPRRWMLDLVVGCMQFGSLVIYAQWSGRLVNQVLCSFVTRPIPVVTTDGFWIFAVIAAFVFPLTMFRTIGKLDVVSFFSTFFIVMLIAHAAYWLVLDSDLPRPTSAFALENWRVVITSFSVNSLAFTCHVNLFPVCSALKNCTIRRARILGVVVVIGAWTLYNAFGLVTYIDRPQQLLDSPTALLLYYPTRNAFTIIATLGVVVLLVGSCPAVLWALRNSVNHAVFKDTAPSPARWIAMGGVLVWLPALLASLSDDVITCFNVAGGLFTPIVTFMLPALFYLRCASEKTRGMRYLAYQHVVFTVVGAVASTYQAIDNIVHPNK